MADSKYHDDQQAKNAELIVPSERRTYPRIALSVPVSFSIVKEEPGAPEAEHDVLMEKGAKNIESNLFNSTETMDLSSGGLMMTTEKEIKCGTLLHMTMCLPMPGIACNCEMLAEVVRSMKNEDGTFKTGVNFLKIVHHNLNKFRYATLKDMLNIDGPRIKLD